MKTLVIASVLKPVNDTRMYEKLGFSLSKSGKYNVNIIGCHSEIPDDNSINFYPDFTYKRQAISRLTAWKRLLERLRQLKPDILILCTWELLPVLRHYQCEKVIYDCIENYYLNAGFSGGFRGLLVQQLIRFYERRWFPRIDQFLISDASYLEEMQLPKEQTTLVQNKYRQIDASAPDRRNEMNLLFSGTISRSFGVFRSIDLAIKLRQQNNSVSLTIIGFCALPGERRELQRIASQNTWITLIGVDRLVPHNQIIEQVKKADFGLISYEHHPHILSCTPTRLFEYLGEELPILLTDHQPWLKIAENCDGAIPVDFDGFDEEIILKLMKSKTFYSSYPTDVFWESEEEKLLQALE